MNDIMVAKRTALEAQAEEDESASEVASPGYTFETIQPNGVFSIYFDKGLTGLDFISELGVELKMKGSLSKVYADELDASDEQDQNEETNSSYISHLNKL